MHTDGYIEGNSARMIFREHELRMARNVLPHLTFNPIEVINLNQAEPERAVVRNKSFQWVFDAEKNFFIYLPQKYDYKLSSHTYTHEPLPFSHDQVVNYVSA